jgi:protein TonB
MRAGSSIVSLGFHVALALAVLLGSAKARPTLRTVPPPAPLLFAPTDRESREAGIPVPGPLIPDGDWSLPPIDVPLILPQRQAFGRTFSPTPGAATTTGSPGGSWVNVLEEPPQALSGPLPLYPELLRVAGIQGGVVFEAIVDTTGRIEPGSLTLISTTHPGFVASARQALLATLFRPARVGGRAVRVQVRLPIEFTLRNGMPSAP